MSRGFYYFYQSYYCVLLLIIGISLIETEHHHVSSFQLSSPASRTTSSLMDRKKITSLREQVLSRRNDIESADAAVATTFLEGVIGNDGRKNENAINRRSVLSSFGKAAIIGSISGSGIFTSNAANANEEVVTSSSTSSTTFGASWNAVDGLNSLNSNSQFVSFDTSAYNAMRDDPTRTPQFKKAIEKRLGDNPENKVVVDLGTGPFALFAIIAAQLGAKKVYAIEASADVAQSARAYIKKSGYDDIIEVVEGFSTDVKLDEKADFCIAEIVGSVCSEEGAYATIKSAHSNLLKEPSKDSSWIPSRIQTYAAPASYTLHNLFGPPEFDWAKLNGEPVRFNCRDKGLGLLANPLLVEDISFSQILTKEQDDRNAKKTFTFTVDPQRMEENQLSFYQEFIRGNSTPADSDDLARRTAHSFSGVALWSRIILDDSIIIDSRGYGDGSYQRSHWQTVLPIMSPRPIGNLNGGEKIAATCDFTLPDNILKPPSYSIRGNVQFV